MDKEYIERGAFEEWARLHYCKDCNSYNGALCRSCWLDDAIDLVEDAPTADVVEVVRCKDCVNSKPWYADKIRCLFWCESSSAVDKNGFCSYGERKEQSGEN